MLEGRLLKPRARQLLTLLVLPASTLFEFSRLHTRYYRSTAVPSPCGRARLLVSIASWRPHASVGDTASIFVLKRCPIKCSIISYNDQPRTCHERDGAPHRIPLLLLSKTQHSYSYTLLCTWYEYTIRHVNLTLMEIHHFTSTTSYPYPTVTSYGMWTTSPGRDRFRLTVCSNTWATERRNARARNQSRHMVGATGVAVVL